MKFKTEDGVGPPEDWTLAVCLPGGIGSTGGAVAVMEGKRQAFIIHTGSLDSAYWLACLINDGLGVGEDDPPDPQSAEGE